MNLVLPADIQSYSTTPTGAGTADARIENNHRNAIESTQGPANAKDTRQENESSSGKNRENLAVIQTASPDKVTLSEKGKQTLQKEERNSLSDEEQKQVQTLKDRDREVRVHEQAHAAVGGQYAGSPSYDYQTGPDGKRYAVGGEVSIDVSEEQKPEETIQKMQIVRAAALAPAEPSTQDLKVAAEASQKESQARAQLSQQQLSLDESEDIPAQEQEIQESVPVNTNKYSQAYSDVAAYREAKGFSISV